jgi:hypothetical protein
MLKKLTNSHKQRSKRFIIERMAMGYCQSYCSLECIEYPDVSVSNEVFLLHQLY